MRRSPTRPSTSALGDGSRSFAVEHGLVFASHDHGFRRFSGLRVVDPL